MLQAVPARTESTLESILWELIWRDGTGWWSTHVCVCEHESECMHYIPACEGGGHRPTLGIFLYCSLSCSLETVCFSLNLEYTFWQDWMASEPPGCAVLAPLVLGIKVCAPMPGLFPGCWGSELRSLEGSLFTEPSPLPLDEKAFKAMWSGLGFASWGPGSPWWFWSRDLVIMKTMSILMPPS